MSDMNPMNAGYIGNVKNFGGSILISKYVVTNTAGETNISFYNIPQDFNNLEIYIQARSTNASTSVGIITRFNNDTGSNYTTEYSQAFNTSISCGFNSTTYMYTFEIVAASGDANYAGSGNIYIPNYAATTFNKTLTAIGSCAQGSAGAGRSFAHLTQSSWNNTAAINIVNLIPAAGNFVKGTTACLYGVM